MGIDAAGRLAALSDEGARILGCAPASIGRPCDEVLAHQPEVARLLVSALDGRERAGRAETRLHETAGHDAFTIGYTLLPVRDDEGALAGAAMLFRDLTPYERRDEQDRLHDRLAALGQMAAGLAHELRNPLASVEVLAGLLKRRLVDGEDRELVEELLEEVRTVASAVSASLAFVRPVAVSAEWIETAALLADVEERARRRTAFAGTLGVEVEAGAERLFADPTLLRRALVDVSINAIEAMDGPGQDRASELLLRAGPAVDGFRIDVDDTGPGVPEEIRERIFHPFFTTRPEGTGVGLAEAQKVAAAHAGSLAVQDAPGGGARFRMYLPAPEADAGAGGT